jgi:redox-sensitive bicupin YhaK (pirin superfamily)
MKIIFHRSDSRGIADHGWLHSRHTFSFANYYNPDRMGFGKLRVLNDDIVEPSMGFGTHPHDNMEIVSIPISGTLRHEDSMGNQHIIESGEVQIMSAGTGVTHSEYNNSDVDQVNFLQIWVMPKKLDIKPRYEQKRFDVEKKRNQFQIVVSPDGEKESISINQDVYFTLIDLDKDCSISYQLRNSDNGVYIFMISGSVMLGDQYLDERDGVEVSNTLSVTLLARTSTQLLFIETPIEF